jgi:hypothetical protein
MIIEIYTCALKKYLSHIRSISERIFDNKRLMMIILTKISLNL